jgi:2-polyprenyl-6-methoxyphenol hydroxylase-like FAD-dependent oxidoreductase
VERACVIGGSIAGLLAAAALSGTTDRVTIIERDDLPDLPVGRRCAPQGTQVHALLGAGQAAMESLLPGIGQDFQDAGGALIDAAADLAIYSSQGWSGRVGGTTKVISMRRPNLEFVVRQRVMALPNVEFIQDTVTGVRASADHSAVIGVSCAGVGDIDSDLVVDASGRMSKAPAWYAELGYAAPRDAELLSYIGYATVPVELPEGALPEGVLGILAHPNPRNLRGAAIVPCDNGLHLLAGLGMMKAYPPRDVEEFLAHLDAAPSPLVGEVARQARLLDDVATYRVPGSRRRLWENLPGRPDGLVIIGDAVMAFNPLYGQGMSVAAVQACELRRAAAAHRDSVTGLAEDFHQGIRGTIDTVFEMVRNTDGVYEGAQLRGVAPPDPAQLAYGKALAQLSTEDAEVALALKTATHFFDGGATQTESIKAKVADWIATGRQPYNNDPRKIPEPLD